MHQAQKYAHITPSGKVSILCFIAKLGLSKSKSRVWVLSRMGWFKVVQVVQDTTLSMTMGIEAMEMSIFLCLVHNKLGLT